MTHTLILKLWKVILQALNQGAIEGKLECDQDLEVTASGKLKSETVKAQNVLVSGNVVGTVATVTENGASSPQDVVYNISLHSFYFSILESRLILNQPRLTLG